VKHLANFIQQYLDRGLFNIADSEERLLKLQASAETLASQFVERKEFLVQFLRATLSEKVDELSPALSNIEDHIKTDWPTFRSAQPARPIAIILAVGWQALHLAVIKNPDLSGVIWYGSVNLLNTKTIDPRLDLVIDFIKAQGEDLERRAMVEWNPSLNKVVKQVKSIAVPQIKMALQQSLIKASTSIDTAGAAIEGGNPHAAGDGAWGAFFGKTTANAITTALTELSKGIVDTVQASFDDLSKKFTAVSTELNRSHLAQGRKTELLWLAESRYSPRLQKAYEKLSAQEATVVLAVDMAESVGRLSPQSVEYFLAETIEHIYPNQTIKLETLVRELSKSPVRDVLPANLFQPPENTSQLSLLEFIGAVAASKADLKEFQERTGLQKNTSKSLGELSRLLYREIKLVEWVHEDIWS
jgi:hypothetical protein